MILEEMTLKTAFITDSGTGLSIKESQEKGIFSVPLQIIYDNDSKLDLEEITYNEINTLLKSNTIIKTSLPSAGLIDALFEKLVQEGYQRVFCICITRGISSTADTFSLLAKQYNLEMIYVDCYSTAFIQQYCITEAKKMYDNNHTIEEIIAYCEYIIKKSDTFIIPASCDQLIKSGRLTGFAASLAGLLKIKPWLHLNESTKGKIDAIGKARTQAKLLKQTIDLMKENIKEKYHIHVIHVDALEYAKQIKLELEEIFHNTTIMISNLIAPVAVHTGLGSIAIQYYPSIEAVNNNESDC